jgi:ureidoacrylate peracid hydrolase
MADKLSAALTTLEEKLLPEHTVLLMVDMQNDFCSGEGKMASFGFDVSMVQQVVPTLKAFLASARKLGIFVVHTRVINDAAQNSPSWYAFWGPPAVTVEGTWGAEFYPGFEPLPDELVVTKYAYGAFDGTNLDSILRRRDIRTLAVAGTGGLICSGDTMHRGFALGYHIVAVEDCVADFTVQGPEWTRTVHEVGMYITARHYGHVQKSADVLKIWKAHLGAKK